MRAAVPDYARNALDELPPGHRFRMFFEGWDDRFLLPETGSSAAEQVAKALRSAGRMAPPTRRLLEAVRGRQRAVAALVGACSWKGLALSPLLVGTGQPHPVENGFSFGDPYGLPLLPGSSIKGVVRRAAEELALSGSAACRGGWTLPRVWIAFGFDANAGWFRQGGAASAARDDEALATAYRNHIAALEEEELREAAPLLEPHAAAAGQPLRTFLLDLPNRPAALRAIHTRGMLVFLDAFVSPPAAGMGVDVLTPHHRTWYTEDQVPDFGPHDAESPTPVRFLVLPANSRLELHVHVGSSPVLGAEVAEAIVSALPVAVEHAATEIGFGAKTNAGYGRFALEAQR